MNSPLKIGMLGCGVVGTGLLHLLRDRASEIEQAVGARVKVTRVAVADPKKPREAALDGATLSGDAMAVAEADDIDLLVEVMGGADRALPPVTRALERGLPVVTANKLLVANHGAELEAVAARTGTTLRYEASVAGVIPVLQSLDQGLRTERFQLLVGIL
ncbi:MAG TPA: homoserine dehydrogenase, partial [Candidatus Eisenbacteria bacterium]|nr:homoserine dehydrogenase [Candidatus Eisenbacteria bacterium]